MMSPHQFGSVRTLLAHKPHTRGPGKARLAGTFRGWHEMEKI